MMTTRTKNKTLFCMFCVCVCERNSAQKIQFPFFAPSSSGCPVFWCSQMLLSQPGGFLDRVCFGAGIYSGSFFLKLLFHNKYKFWNMGRNLLDFFLFWVSTIEDGCDFLLRGHDPDPEWPPSLLRWRWMTFTVCVCVFV